MNILQLQDDLKNMSKQQLMQQMQRPDGTAPQYLVMSELQRRKKQEASLNAAMNPQKETTVAEDMMGGGAGVPAQGLGQIAQAMKGPQAPGGASPQSMGAMPKPPAPGAMPPGGMPQPPTQRMAEGGTVRMAGGKSISDVSSDLNAYKAGQVDFSGSSRGSGTVYKFSVPGGRGQSIYVDQMDLDKIPEDVFKTALDNGRLVPLDPVQAQEVPVASADMLSQIFASDGLDDTAPDIMTKTPTRRSVSSPEGWPSMVIDTLGLDSAESFETPDAMFPELAPVAGAVPPTLGTPPTPETPAWVPKTGPGSPEAPFVGPPQAPTDTSEPGVFDSVLGFLNRDMAPDATRTLGDITGIEDSFEALDILGKVPKKAVETVSNSLDALPIHGKHALTTGEQIWAGLKGDRDEYDALQGERDSLMRQAQWASRGVPSFDTTGNSSTMYDSAQQPRGGASSAPQVNPVEESLLPKARPDGLGPKGPAAPAGPSGGGGGVSRMPNAGEKEQLVQQLGDPKLADSLLKDKWLALARFGMGLMADNTPGSIGRAGIDAIDSFRQAKLDHDAREKMLSDKQLAERGLDLEERSIEARLQAARIAASGRGGRGSMDPKDIIDYIKNLGAERAALTGIDGKPTAGSEGDILLIDAEIKRYKDMLGTGYGIGPTADRGAPAGLDLVGGNTNLAQRG